MVPKSGTRLPKTRILLSDMEFAAAIGNALKEDLGGSRRASKSIMAWTGVSDHTARAWINGHVSPSAVHMIMLAAHCRPVMRVMLQLTGNDVAALAIELGAIENALENLLKAARRLRSHGSQ